MQHFELDKMLTLSTAHIEQSTLELLNDTEKSGDLPFWIHSTSYGFIIRFNAMEASEEGSDTDFKNALADLKQRLSLADISVIHLDCDAPVYPCLPEYSGLELADA